MVFQKLNAPPIPPPDFVSIRSQNGRVATVLDQVRKVSPERLADPPELHLSLVLPAEGEGPGGDVVVRLEEGGVCLQDIQHGAVHLPEKLQGGKDDRGVDALAAVRGGHR